MEELKEPMWRDKLPKLEPLSVAGISGRFPESDDMNSLSANLFQGIDMITDDGRRWTPGIYGTPKRSGKLMDLDKFDAEYFGIHAKQAHVMDPQMRTLLEVTYEAIMDSGVNPLTIRNTNTGVFIGSAGSESYELQLMSTSPDDCDGYGLTGGYRTMLANRISFAFDFSGPSFSIDSACSSSLTALEQAVKAIRIGQCEAAIVGGVSLCLNPVVSLMYSRMGALSEEGKCKTFDDSNNGFVRSEAVVAIYLTRADVTPRSYAKILHVLTNTDGYKEEGITFPSSSSQTTLLEQIYSEAGVNPCDVTYVEAHGTGTKVGDPQEVNAITKVFCNGREAEKPLLIGSVKSNMGHGEAAAGLCGLAKLVLAIHKGILPANLHFSSPNMACPSLHDGRLQVVSKNTPWEGGLVGVSSFGFGGANAHAILRSNPKMKPASQPLLPLLFPFSGRTEQAVHDALTSITAGFQDGELAALLQNIFRTPDAAHKYRGYAVLSEDKAVTRVVEVKKPEGKPVWFIFSGMGSQWNGMGRDLLQFKAFNRSFLEASETLKPLGIDLLDILWRGNEETLNNLPATFATIVSIQIGLVDLMSSLGIEPDGMIGHSVGELACAYADGCLTARQAVMAAYVRGRAIVESEVPIGSMGAVGLPWDDLEKRSPPGIFLACHNSADNVTVSGLDEPVKKFLEELKAEGVFAKAVNSNGIAFHSPLIGDAAPKLRKYLGAIISSPNRRSQRWISSSILDNSPANILMGQTCSPEYLVNNLMSPVYFHKAVKHVPENAFVIEIAPHCLFQSILRRSLSPSCVTIGLTDRSSSDHCSFLLNAIGTMYMHGLNPEIANLYDKTEYPVSTKASLISPLIKWDHSSSWNVAKYRNDNKITGQQTVEVSLDTEAYEFLRGHVIDGRIVFPATGYIYLVWKEFASLTGSSYEILPVVFEKFSIKRAIIIPKEGSIKFCITLFEGSGEFEVVENGIPAASGVIRKFSEDENVEFSSQPFSRGSSSAFLPLMKGDVYKELRLRGYGYQGIFQGIVGAENESSWGTLKWDENWITFLDTLLQFKILRKLSRTMYLPTGIERVIIDPTAFRRYLEGASEELVTVLNHTPLDVISCVGIELHGIKTSTAPKKLRIQSQPQLEEYRFSPYFDEGVDCDGELCSEVSIEEAIHFCVKVAMENSQGFTFVTNEYLTNAENSLAKIIHSCVRGEPRYTARTTIFTTREEEEKLSGIGEKGISIKIATPEQRDDKSASRENSTNHLVVVDSDSLTALAAETVSVGSFLLLKNWSNGDLLGKGMFDLVSKKISRVGIFCLLRKRSPPPLDKPIVISVRHDQYSWVDELKVAMHDAANNRSERFIILTNQGSDKPVTGVLGLVKCLKLEPGGNMIRCFVALGADTAVARSWDFNAPSKDLQNVIERDLVTNIFENNTWGCYQHFEMKEKQDEVKVPVKSAYINTLARGNLSTLSWIQSPMIPQLTGLQSSENENCSSYCTVHYSALNFRDIMFATGKLTPDVLPGNRPTQECILGIEFSGKRSSGQRVMGILPAEGLATHVSADPIFTWDVPQKWTLAEAATVPMAYGTAYYALLVRGKLKPGESVLIHHGSGGVGIAGIAIALSMGCTVYTTVGSTSKKEFLQTQFPALKKTNILNSRDSSFEYQILRDTLGNGVDVVLNSVAGELLQASVRCLAVNGRFLEIGKADLSNNASLGMSIFLKNVSFHGILVDILIDEDSDDKREVSKLVANGIASGIVQPLPFTVFEDQQVEEAFRFMASGKHTGKVMLKIRGEEDTGTEAQLFKAIPRTYFCSWKSYVIIGGLGGFGLELANFLVERGARKLVLVSRFGITSGYQDLCIRRWRKLNVEVVVSVCDVTTHDGAHDLIQKHAAKLGPVGGIFNLAMVLRDGLLQDLSQGAFQEVALPKIDATLILDELSRKYLGQLDHFVVFSSTSSGRGNLGQSNYALANSVMERVCEARRKDGLPGLAIQWGAIGDVGVVHEQMGGNSVLVGGTVPQNLVSCLQVLDSFLQQSHPTVSSTVLPLLDSEDSDSSEKSMGLFSSVIHVLGLKEDSILNKQATLAELGMDSLMGVEVKQLFDHNNVMLSMGEIRQLTLKKIEEMNNEEAPKSDNQPPLLPIQIQMYLENIMPKEGLVRMNESEIDQCLFMVHPIEGSVASLQHLASNVKAQVYGLQCVKSAPVDSIPALAAYYISLLKVAQPKGPYTILGYSYGCCVSIEMALQLEGMGERVAKIIFLDGSIKSTQLLASAYQKKQAKFDDTDFLNDALSVFLIQFLPVKYTEFHAELQSIPSVQKKLDRVAEVLMKTYPRLVAADIKDAGYSFFQKAKASLSYNPGKKITGGFPLLLRAEENKRFDSLGYDYGLSELCEQKVEVVQIHGDHQTCIDQIYSSDVAKIVNRHLHL